MQGRIFGFKDDANHAMPDKESVAGRRLCARQSLSQESNLSGVVRLVLADMKPLAIVIGRAPGKVLVNGHKPGIITLAELRQGFRTSVAEDVQVIVAIVTLDCFPARVSQIHRRIPLLFYRIGPGTPFLAFEGIELVVSFGGSEVQHQGPDGVGGGINEMVQICRGQVPGGADHAIRFAHPSQLRDEISQLWSVARSRSKNVQVWLARFEDFRTQERS